MERAAQHIYTQYIESTEHETANQSIYDEARAHASDRLKDLIREGMETEAEATMIEAMAGGHMQGFIEDFMYASKLWDETTTEDWSRSRSSAGPMTKDGPPDAPEWPLNDGRNMRRPTLDQGQKKGKAGPW